MKKITKGYNSHVIFVKISLKLSNIQIYAFSYLFKIDNNKSNFYAFIKITYNIKIFNLYIKIFRVTRG